MALEDALILTQKLYGMLRSTPNTEDHETPEHERIHQALVEFQRERHERTNFITTRSYRIGRMMQTGWTVVDFVRDRFVIPLVLNKNTFVAHTLFDVGKLPTQSP
jgi:2-polyprenyl-6-methoxyphenol hydroxylase-like FAD-dependent oxidoreductase